MAQRLRPVLQRVVVHVALGLVRILSALPSRWVLNLGDFLGSCLFYIDARGRRVARQNLRANDAIFSAADVDMVMQSGVLIGRRIIDLLTNPLLSAFLRKAREQNEEWANILVSRVVGIVVHESPPETWTLTVDSEQTPALLEAADKRLVVRLSHLLRDPRDVDRQLPCVPLFLQRANHDEQLLPEDDTVLQAGDRLLFCGRTHAETHMRWTTHNFHALNFICTGQDRPIGTVWRLFSGHPRS